MFRIGVPMFVAWLAMQGTAAPPAIKITHAARSLQPGELVVLTIVTPKPSTSIEVRALERVFPAYSVDESTWKALVGIDLEVKPGRYSVTVSSVSKVAGEKARGTHTLVVTAKAFPTRQLTVDPAFVEPPPEAVERIQRDARDLDQVWKSSGQERLWQDGFVRPVPDDANSAFGTRSVFNGQPRSPHSGADFKSPSGRPIAAPSRGRVALARDLYFTGNTVILDHGLGLFSMFAHLSAINVKDGDVVTSGQIIGEVGATGRVTGPHLHWTVRLSGTRIDPLSLLSVLGTSAPRTHPPSSETLRPTHRTFPAAK
jgi:murein DD-endopeptidase MepM/ murein hydrolase activator NlpD